MGMRMRPVLSILTPKASKKKTSEIEARVKTSQIGGAIAEMVATATAEAEIESEKSARAAIPIATHLQNGEARSVAGAARGAVETESGAAATETEGGAGAENRSGN